MIMKKYYKKYLIIILKQLQENKKLINTNYI